MISCSVLLIVFKDTVGEALEFICDWMQDNQFLGPFVLSMIFIVATPLMVPGLLMTAGTGYIMQTVYKVKWKAILYGVLTVGSGVWLGSLISFLVGRYILKDFSARLFKKYKVLAAFNTLFVE